MEFKEFFYLMERITSPEQKYGITKGIRTPDRNAGAWGSNVPGTLMPNLNVGMVGVNIPNVPGIGGATPAPGHSQTQDLPLWSGGFWNTDWINMDFDLQLPSTEKSGIIKIIKKHVNPIVISFADDRHRMCRIYIPFDAYKRISPEPEVGRTMTISMQRRMEDPSKAPSKIDSIRVF